MSEQQFLWNSLDGGENVFIKERGSDKTIRIKIIEGKYEFVDFMKKVNEQQTTINKLREILAEAEDMIEVRLAEHYIKEYENIKHHIIGDNDE